MTVHVIGLGQIGLSTAMLLAQDHDVVGVDIDDERVDLLNDGELPFHESGLAELFEAVTDRFVARATPRPTGGAEPGDEYVIATPTPLEGRTRVANLEHVQAAAETVASVLSPGDLVILESTVPPGTSTRLMLPILSEAGVSTDEFGYAHCPERAIPGNTIYEMVHNDRVIGVTSATDADRIEDLYGFVEGEIHHTTPTTAEFVKLIENTFRDVNIAAANEFAKLAELYGIDGRAAIELANEHPRVDILSPGPGVGGHCLPIDPTFLTQAADGSRLIAVARDINDSMTNHAMTLTRGLVRDVARPRITVMGVAYKADVGDTRETPARRFTMLARNEGYVVRLHDPLVDDFEFGLEPLESAVEDSDCLVFLTGHSAFREIDPADVGATMNRRNAVDTRGLLEEDRWSDAGFTVRTLGDGSWSRTDDVADERVPEEPGEANGSTGR